MSKYWKRVLIALPFTAVVLFAVGEVAMSRYGLDPPYAYFYAGMYLKLTSFALAIAFFVALAVIGIRRGLGRGRT